MKLLGLISLLILLKNSGLAIRILFSSSQQESPNNRTFQNICNKHCLCGTFSHPLQTRFERKYGAFGAEMTPQIDSFVSSDVSLTFPSNGILCIGHPLYVFPTDPETNETFSQFLLKITVLVLRQGNLNRLRQNDVTSFKNTLEYLDLSRNKIEFIEDNTFRDFNNLQEVNLRFNQLTTLSGFDLKPVHLKTQESAGLNEIENSTWFRPLLRVRGNPLSCSCALVRVVHGYVIVPTDDNAECIEVKANGLRSVKSLGGCSLESTLKSLCGEEREQAPASIENMPVSPEDFMDLGYDHFNEPSDRDFKVMTSEEKHESMDHRLNISGVHGDEEKESPCAHQHRVLNRKGKLDVPLLLTMSIWFIMIYFGIIRFIKSNEMDRDVPLAMPIKSTILSKEPLV